MKNKNLYCTIRMADLNPLTLNSNYFAKFLFDTYKGFVTNEVAKYNRLEEFFYKALKNIVIANYNNEGKIPDNKGFYVVLPFCSAVYVNLDDGGVATNAFAINLFNEITSHVREWSSHTGFIDYLSTQDIDDDVYDNTCKELGFKTLADLFFYSFAFNYSYSSLNGIEMEQEKPYWMDVELLEYIEVIIVSYRRWGLKNFIEARNKAKYKTDIKVDKYPPITQKQLDTFRPKPFQAPIEKKQEFNPEPEEERYIPVKRESVYINIDKINMIFDKWLDDHNVAKPGKDEIKINSSIRKRVDEVSLLYIDSSIDSFSKEEERMFARKYTDLNYCNW